MTNALKEPATLHQWLARRALHALAALMLGLLCIDAYAADDLPWAANKGVSAVSGYAPDGAPIDYLFAPTQNILNGGQVWYRAVTHFGDAHKQAWDTRGWREIPGGMKTSERLASAWVSAPDAPAWKRTVWIAAIDEQGRYRIASYKPWGSNGGESWGGWFDMGSPPQAAFNGPPAIVSYGNYVRLFATSNGTLWMRTYNHLTETWSGWTQEVGGLYAGTGIAASAMRMNFSVDEKAVLAAVKANGTIIWRVYGQIADNFWTTVPGGKLTDVTPTLARSSSTRLRLIVKDANTGSLSVQTLTDGALWKGWTAIHADVSFDPKAAPLSGAGGPAATWQPPSAMITTNGGTPRGALRLYMDGSGEFQTVYAASMLEVDQGVNDAFLIPANFCLVYCTGLPDWQEIPGTAIPTLNLQPIPTLPTISPPPHHGMVASDGPAQARPCGPLFADVRVARMPLYGTDFLLGRTQCGTGLNAKTLLFWRSSANLGRANAMWDERGWIQLPGADSYRGHDIATVGSELWAVAVATGGRISMTRIKKFNSANQLVWDDWQDITADLPCVEGFCAHVVDGSPAIVAANGLVWIWFRDSNGNLWRRIYNRNTETWQGGWDIDQPGIKVAPGQTVAGTEFVHNGQKRTLFVAVGTAAPQVQGSIYYMVPEVSHTWIEIPGGGKSNATPAVARSAANKIHVIVRGTDTYWYQSLTDGSSWRSSWTQLPGNGVFTGGIASVRGPSAVFRSGGYLDPAAPNAASWDATPALHVYGGSGASLFGTSFVSNGYSALQLRENGWTQVPSTAPVPPPPTAPKPPVIYGPDGTVIPPPPQPGTPEWDLPVVSEPINQWYPFCLAWSQWDGINLRWWDQWSQTIYYPGENFTEADNLGLEVMYAENDVIHPDPIVQHGEYVYQSWAAGACP